MNLSTTGRNQKRMTNEKQQPNQRTTFTIPLDKVKITGAHVHFALYANGAKTGDLCMSQAEFKIFEATICDENRHSNQFDLGMMISEHHNMMRAGWKRVCIERYK